MKQKLLYLFTRTPLHVGAGASVGAIDQPIQRERHTGFPLIPASSLKGTFADVWNDDKMRARSFKRVRKNEDGSYNADTESAWLFGSDEANHSFAGALQFSEAKLLAFPIRSAKGSFAWITCPLMLQRASRDGVIPGLKPDGKPDTEYLPQKEPEDGEAIWAGTTLDLGGKVVLEEYTFSRAKNGQAEVPMPRNLPGALAKLMEGDAVWSEVASRLVILNNGMMSFFAQNACEVAQHVKISDETGTAEGGALFNQENVPSETLFYSVLHAFDERTANKAKDQRRDGGKAIETFETKLKAVGVFQFGGDASTGLGYCTVKIT